MTQLPELIPQKFALQIESVEDLRSAGGFSGANLWRIETVDGDPFCVRRWPKETDRNHLDWIHLVLHHARIDCRFVAAPIRTSSGENFLVVDESVFEVAPWMPGVADFSRQPTGERLSAAVTALAKFHLAAAQVNLDFRVSKNLVSRIEMLQNFESRFANIKKMWDAGIRPQAAQQLQHLDALVLALAQVKPPLMASMETQLQQGATTALPHQPVIRDVWHDHVLFSGDEVTGLVDFGAMQMDCVSLDLSRLLGSLIGDDELRMNSALDTYQSLRRLSAIERQLVRPLDQAASILGGLNWLTWLVGEGRTFSDWIAVDARLEQLGLRILKLVHR